LAPVPEIIFFHQFPSPGEVGNSITFARDAFQAPDDVMWWGDEVMECGPIYAGMEVEGHPHERSCRQEQALKERHQEQDQREQNQPDPDWNESDSRLVA
jgi:hypothetical protein